MNLSKESKVDFLEPGASITFIYRSIPSSVNSQVNSYLESYKSTQRVIPSTGVYSQSRGIC